MFLVIIFGNVLMNEWLDKMDLESEVVVVYWFIYGCVWISWNMFCMIGLIVIVGCYLLVVVYID